MLLKKNISKPSCACVCQGAAKAEQLHGLDLLQWMLTQDSIFSNQPFYLSKPLGEHGKSPSKRREHLLITDEQNFQNWCEADIINTLGEIKLTASTKLSDPYMFKLMDNSIYIYKIEYLECPKITRNKFGNFKRFDC